MRINKKERVSEKPPRKEKGVKEHVFDANQGGGARTKRKTMNHVEKLAQALHGSDPYSASHEN